MADRIPFPARLRTAGIEPSDDEALRLGKTLLVFATGLVSIGSALWVVIYWLLGPAVSTTAALAFQLAAIGNLFFYVQARNFAFFAATQLGLFLFGPFLMQWAFGGFIDSSGLVLWGLLAPVGAILCFGARRSVVWFAAWVLLVVLSGLFDLVMASKDVGFVAFAVPHRTIVVCFTLNFISVATIIYLLLRHAIQQKQKAQREIERAHGLLVAEQDRSQRLLLNVLPAPIAERLKQSDQPLADGFGEATIMFADLVNFTKVASNLSPNEVFAMLNRIFSAFDELAERFGLEKIKTIGDSYMVAGGLNEGPGGYTAAIADMAIAMNELLRRDCWSDTARLELRIGIATGPVVAGVVGRKKFIYDVWGDTVNIASRITKEGMPGAIQCDRATRHRLRETFEFEGPQAVHLKGRGDMKVYRLIGRKGAISKAGKAGSKPAPAHLSPV